MSETSSINNSKFAKLDEQGRRSLNKLVPDPVAVCATGSKGNETMVAKYAALTQSVIGELPQVKAENIPEIFERARAAAKAWQETTFAERSALVRRFARIVLDEQDAILDVIQWENGKNRASAFEEYYDVINNSLYYARRAEKFLKPRNVLGAVPGMTFTKVQYLPLGVVGVITPWNYPFNLSISDAIPALMAGNAIVLKPDSQTPYCALVVRSLLTRAGFPADLFQVVIGTGREIGNPLIDNSDYMMFTGSTATGRSIAKRSGENLIGFSAEMGGKNPMIVRADAPLPRAAKGAAKACFSSSGQLCISVERMFIHKDIWDEFVPAFVAAANAIKLDAAMDWKSDMGPLISDAQLTKVQEHIKDALDKGATLLAGGELRTDIAPRAFPPTVLTDVTPDMRVFAEETFGPVVSLYKVDSDEEALEKANATNYGLNGAIWSSDLKTAQKLAKRLLTGSVNINDGYAATWGSIGAPTGGIKDSGLADRHGREGILKYTDTQTVATQHIMHIAAPKWLGEKNWARFMHVFSSIQHKLRISL